MLRKRFLKTTLLTLVAAAVALAAAAVPGWRHRHAGGVGHTHSHGHSPLHSHSHSHAGHGHSHGGHRHQHGHGHSRGHMHGDPDQAGGHDRDGWHVHVSLFGFEFTLWEPGASVVETWDADETNRPRKLRRGDSGEGAVLLATQPVTAGWVSLFFVDPAPVPANVRLVGAGMSRLLPRLADGRFDAPADPPPVPPPEAASSRGVRRPA